MLLFVSYILRVLRFVIDYVLFEDLQDKCKFIYSHKKQIINYLKAFRSIRLRLIYAVTGFEEAANDITRDVEFARVTLDLEGLLAETISTTVEACTDAAIDLDDIGAEDPQSYMTPAHTFAVGPPGCRSLFSWTTIRLGDQYFFLDCWSQEYWERCRGISKTTKCDEDTIVVCSENSEEYGKVSFLIIKHEGMNVESSDTLKALTPTTLALKVI